MSEPPVGVGPRRLYFGLKKLALRSKQTQLRIGQTNFRVYLDPELAARLDGYAAVRNLSRNSAVTQAIAGLLSGTKLEIVGSAIVEIHSEVRASRLANMQTREMLLLILEILRKKFGLDKEDGK